MHQRRFFTLFAAASFALMLVVPVSAPAGADPVDGCTTGMFPTTPGSPSGLNVSCTFTTATAAAGTVMRIEDFSQAQWASGGARVTHADGHLTLNSATVTSATGKFKAADVDRGISGTGIKPGSFIKAVTSATVATMSQTASASETTDVLMVDYSKTRKVTDASTVLASTTLTSATANFKAADVGDGVRGTNIPEGTTITAVPTVTTITLSAPATATATHQGVVIEDPHTGGASLQVHDMHTTAGSKTITSAMAASYLADPLNIGLAVAGASFGNANIAFPRVAGEPRVAGDPIPGVDVSLEQIPGGIAVPANRTTTGSVLTLGHWSSGAARNAEPVAYFSVERAVSPVLVPGSPACSANVLTGSTMVGTWHNPGSFVGGSGVASSEAAVINGPVLGQISFSTSVIAFAGYVVQEKASTPGESDTSAHDDVDFPADPVSFGLCAAPSTVGVSENLRFVASTASQTLSGNGSVRSLAEFPAAATTATSTAWVHLMQGTTPVFDTSTDCAENYPGTPAFDCGS